MQTDVAPLIVLLAITEYVIVTTSWLGGQGPLLIVHVNEYIPPTKPVIVLVGDEGLVITAVPGPAVCVHTPVPMPAVFADKAVDGMQIF